MAAIYIDDLQLDIFQHYINYEQGMAQHQSIGRQVKVVRNKKFENFDNC